jgi:hypothetical protein
MVGIRLTNNGVGAIELGGHMLSILTITRVEFTLLAFEDPQSTFRGLRTERIIPG